MVKKVRQLTRESIQDAHVIIHQWCAVNEVDPSDVACIMYGLHVLVPALVALLFLRYPWLRPALILGMVCLVIIQMTSGVCPVAKLEWRLDPDLEAITWQGLDMIPGVTQSKAVKFYVMMATTTSALLLMLIVARLFPNGI